MIDIPVLAKDALREGNTKKNYRFDVYNDDESEVDFTIDNDNLIKESVKIDERMCSESEIKFGLCEGTELEFQCFGIPNITNRRFKAFIDVQYFDENKYEQWCSVTLGWFTVKECSRQASTGIMKMSCYNKLLSDYLDQKANNILKEMFSTGETLTLHDIENAMLGNYKIEPKRENVTTASPSLPTVVEDTQDIFTGNLLLTQNYGIESPINGYYFLQNGHDATVEPFRLSMYRLAYRFPYHIDNVRKYDIVGALYGTLQGLYDSFKKYFIDSINNAHIIYADTLEEVDGEDVWNRISSSTKNNWFKIEIEYRNGSSVFWDTYNGESGNLDVLEGRMLLEKPFGQPNSAYTLGTTIRVYTAGSIYAGYSIGSGRLSRECTVDFTAQRFKHYNDNELSELIETYAPPFCYSDGTEGSFGQLSLCKYNFEGISSANNITQNIDDMPEFTLRELATALFELDAEFGRLDRETDLFSGIELNGSRLLPADNLYPADDLYPMSMSERSNKSMYSKLWADEGNVRNFRYLIITYKGTEVDPDTQQVSEVEKTLQRTVNNDGTDDYNMSDNWLFKNIVWSDEDVGSYADAMVEKMRNITWFPFEMWCAGLPYIETGDEVEINMGDGAYTSYVLRRNLKGIQNLQDEMINGTLDIF